MNKLVTIRKQEENFKSNTDQITYILDQTSLSMSYSIGGGLTKWVYKNKYWYPAFGPRAMQEPDLEQLTFTQVKSDLGTYVHDKGKR